MPVDWVGLAGVIMGTLIVLIPVAGLTIRFAMKPITEAIRAYKASEGRDEKVQILERRMAFLEQQNEHLESELARLSEAVQFHERLEAPGE